MSSHPQEIHTSYAGINVCTVSCHSTNLLVLVLSCLLLLPFELKETFYIVCALENLSGYGLPATSFCMPPSPRGGNSRGPDY